MSKRFMGSLAQNGKMAKVYYDHELSEYTVTFWDKGVKQKDADYFTSDMKDAADTASSWVGPCTRHL